MSEAIDLIVSSRILLKSKNQIVLDEGDGYRLRATAHIVGTFTIIAIDWEHPNYGYFADAMLCFASLHAGWRAIPIANWCNDYVDNENILNLEKFLKNYPKLKAIFRFDMIKTLTISP